MRIQTPIKQLASVAGVFAVVLAVAVVPCRAESFPDLGAAKAYAVLGTTGVNVNLSNVTVNGDVGVPPSGKLNFAAASDVFGNIFVDSTATVTMNSGVFHGGSLITGQNLSQAVADAINASSQADALTATQTFGAITTNTTITGNGGLNVIDIASINLSSSCELCRMPRV